MHSRLHEHDAYRTSDLALAAALALFYPLDALDHREAGQTVFVFRRDAPLDVLVERYWRGVLRVEPQMYYQQVRALAAHISSEVLL